MNVKVHIMNMWSIVETKAITVSNLIAISSLVSEIWLTTEGYTHTHARTHYFGYILIFSKSEGFWKPKEAIWQFSLIFSVPLATYGKRVSSPKIGTACTYGYTNYSSQDPHVKTWQPLKQDIQLTWRSSTRWYPVSGTILNVYHDIMTTTTKNISNTLHADDLEIWPASEHTSTATYRLQEGFNSIIKWTEDCSLEINNQNQLFSLSTSKEQTNRWLKYQVLPETDTPTFWGVIEGMERENLRKLELMRKLTGTNWGAVTPTMAYVSTTWRSAAKTN